MSNILTKDLQITTSFCDYDFRLGIYHTFNLLMDIATVQSEESSFGLTEMAQKGLFWVAVRTKVHFHLRPRLLERVTLSTWPAAPEERAYRCMRYYEMKDQSGSLIIEAKNEWAALSITSGRPPPISLAYPPDFKAIERTSCPGDFSHIEPDFAPEEERGEYIVRATDIDGSKHMNNTAYIRVLMDAFSVKEQKELAIKDIEVAYRAQCFEGERLKIMVRKIDNGHEAALFKEDGQTALLARITG